MANSLVLAAENSRQLTRQREQCRQWFKIMVDKASWHKGVLIKQVLVDHSHLERYPLPSYSPKLQVIERFWTRCGKARLGGG